jgi:hypothetical protein
MNTASPPIAATRLVRRKCCSSGAKFYLEPPDVDETIAYRVEGKRPEAAGEVNDTPPAESTAWHESSHAVFGYAFGMPVDIIRVCKPALVKFKHGNNLTAPMRIAVDFAGAVGEMARTRCWSTLSPDDEDDYLSRIEAGLGGGCDECGMARWAWMSVGLSAGKVAAREVFRAGQLLALSIGQRRDVLAAIRALAAALMEHHTMTGAEAHAVIEPYVQFGSLR